MRVETEVKRIGGSTFARLPPELVRSMDLRAGDRIMLDVERVGGTAEDVMALRGRFKGLPKLDRLELWGE